MCPSQGNSIPAALTVGRVCECVCGGRHLGVSASPLYHHPLPGQPRIPLSVGRISSAAGQH